MLYISINKDIYIKCTYTSDDTYHYKAVVPIGEYHGSICLCVLK